MGLLSFFKRSAANQPAPASAPESIEQARTRARHRLIGAAVLVVIGVIGFPLLFETQPRPIPVDLPIEIPKKDGAPPLAVPAAKPQQATAPAEAQPKAPEVITESAADAGREVPVAAREPSAPATEPRTETARVEQRPAATEPKQETPKPKPEPTRPEPAKPGATESARAQALLEGREAPKPAATGARFVVQVGAYSEQNSARDMRAKVEKLGLKTYTQVVDTGGGKRIRVRVGPFASREEADRASAKLKAAGLPSAVLTL